MIKLRPLIRKLILLFAISIFLCYSSEAQRKVQLENYKFHANVFPVSVSAEIKTSPKSSLLLGGGVNYGFALTRRSDAPGLSGGFLIAPITYLALRTYYERNSVKKKNLRPNSGNFFGVLSFYNFESFGYPKDDTQKKLRRAVDDQFVLGFVWGIQRNYNSGLHLGLNIGLGTSGFQESISFGPIGLFELGYQLNK